MLPTPDQTERAKTHFFAGLAALDVCNYSLAEQQFKAALAIAPGRLSALVNLAAALFRQEKLAETIAIAEEALVADPNSVDALIARGSAFAKLGDDTAALASMERAVAIAPDNVLALVGEASVLLKRKEFALAVANYQAARRLQPDRANLLGLLVAARMHACDWHGLDKNIEDLLAGIRAGSASVEPFSLLAIPSTPSDQLICATAAVKRDFPPLAPLYRGQRYDHDRIRVAYVSGDFRSHPLSRLMAGIFERHDRSRFEVTAVATNLDDGSDERRRIAASTERFADLSPRSNGEIAAWLLANEFDIAVDLGGLTDNGRLPVFAARPAPIQVSYLGFPGTSGAPYLDYLVADRIVIPPDERRHYSEKIAMLPDTYYPTDDSWPVATGAPRRADAGLPDDCFVFCCFNNSYKITPDIFDLWLRLLGAVPKSVLWLLATNATATRNLHREAQRRGVAPDRIVFASAAPFAEHLARHRLADLALDTLPYNAHTTACDALWAGLPLVTCPNETFPGRVAASLLHAMKLPELVTASLAEYEALALALASDPVRLAALKEKVSAGRQTTPLFDTTKRTRDLEAAFATMMERHVRGEAPSDLAV